MTFPTRAATADILPPWIAPMAAVALLVTGDPTVAAEAWPKATPGRHSYVPPAAGEAEPGSPAWRRAQAGQPEDWDGLTSAWLAIWSGSADTVSLATGRLVGALQDGRVASLARSTETAAYSGLSATAWAGATLLPDDVNPRRMVGARRTGRKAACPVPDLEDVLVRRDDVMALLAPTVSEGVAAPPPRITDLPAQWTLFETVAWIMFRDTRIVRGASLETPRPPGTYRAMVALPGEKAAIAELQGMEGYSRLRLDVEWAAQRLEGNEPPGPNATNAVSDLLEKLRSGALQARATLRGESVLQEMSPADWRGLILHEQGRGILTAEPGQATGRFWSDLTVPREDVVKLWPADTGCTAGGSVKPEPMMRPDAPWWTAEQTLAWLAFGLALPWNEARCMAGAPDDNGERMARAQRQLSVAIAGRSLPAWGQETTEVAKPPLRDTLAPIPPEDFAGPSALTVQMNGWAYPPTLGRRYEGRWWQGIRFEAAEVRRLWPRDARTPEEHGAAPSQLRVASTIAAEKRLEDWLTDKMRANPDNSPGKAVIKAEAEAVGHSVSERAFMRAFANAVKAAEAPAWSAPGNKSKRRIETAD